MSNLHVLDVTDREYNAEQELIGFTLPCITTQLHSILQQSTYEPKRAYTLVEINCSLYVCFNGKLHQVEQVKTGELAKDRRTGIEYPARKLGFSQDNGHNENTYPFTHGDVYLLHYNVAVIEVPAGFIFDLDSLDTNKVESILNDGKLILYYDQCMNCVWCSYTEDECARNRGDSSRSIWYITKRGGSGVFSTTNACWNDFYLEGRQPCDFGIRIAAHV